MCCLTLPEVAKTLVLWEVVLSVDIIFNSYKTTRFFFLCKYILRVIITKRQVVGHVVLANEFKLSLFVCFYRRNKLQPRSLCVSVFNNLIW